MKKIIVLLVLFATLSMEATAQYNDLRFGMELSPSFSWLTTDDNQINRSGTNLGLKLRMLGEIQFQENYALATGIGFHFNAGGQLQHDLGGRFWPNSDLGPGLDSLPSGTNLRYNLQYVEIPVGLKMRTREFGYFRYYLQPALTIGFNTQARGDITGRGVGSDAEKLNISQDVRFFNLAWGIGAGVEYSISESTALVGGVAFQLGFSDMNRDDGQYVDDRVSPPELKDEDSKTKNNALTITLGVMF